MTHYILIPEEICQQRRIFTNKPRTRDGRVVVTTRDLSLIRFSLGDVEHVSDTDLADKL